MICSSQLVAITGRYVSPIIRLRSRVDDPIVALFDRRAGIPCRRLRPHVHCRPAHTREEPDRLHDSHRCANFPFIGQLGVLNLPGLGIGLTMQTSQLAVQVEFHDRPKLIGQAASAAIFAQVDWLRPHCC
jgi:hypothetical protein